MNNEQERVTGKFELEINSEGLPPILKGWFDNGGKTVEGDADVLEYRHGNGLSFFPIKMPGLGKVGNAVVNQCTFKKSDTVLEWIDAAKRGTLKPSKMRLSFVYAENATITWELGEAVPKEVSTPVENDHRLEIEKIEFAFSTVTVTGPS